MVIIIRIDIIDKQIRTGIIIIVVLHKSIAAVTFRLREVIFQLTYSLYSGCRFWEILFQFTYSLSSKLSFREVIFKFKYSLYSGIRFRRLYSTSYILYTLNSGSGRLYSISYIHYVQKQVKKCHHMENLFFEIRSVWVVDENQDSDDERYFWSLCLTRLSYNCAHLRSKKESWIWMWQRVKKRRYGLILGSEWGVTAWY